MYICFAQNTDIFNNNKMDYNKLISAIITILNL